ncbi:hypothetical protein EVAR_48325_1 [Eumeta japonica]|uniref:Uncharacterized protein n=1 Tax=Eumeta variegata TaxID=151549 RepID=A0A4C1YQK7_EUMVA|nr:hypothetical protein EVAR_48325_1 [Eumeta japonica]
MDRPYDARYSGKMEQGGDRMVPKRSAKPVNGNVTVINEILDIVDTTLFLGFTLDGEQIYFISKDSNSCSTLVTELLVCNPIKGSLKALGERQEAIFFSTMCRRKLFTLAVFLISDGRRNCREAFCSVSGL